MTSLEHARIPALLRWDADTNASVSGLVTELLEATAASVGSVIGRHAGGADGAAAMLESIFALSPGPERLLLAPSVTSLATRPDLWDSQEGTTNAFDLIVRALAAEAFVSGAMGSSESGVWTIWGDVYMPRGLAGPIERNTAITPIRYWRDDAVFTSPVLPTGTIVDAFSPAAVGGLPEIPDGDSLFTSGEYKSVLSKLTEAIEWMGAASSYVCWVFARIVRIVVLRRDTRLVGYRAASSSSGIGRVVLRNPHLQSATVPEIVDALVHEMIHAVLDLVEIRSPFVGAEFKGERVPSPWTGRPLDLRTYIHACFVWYGLLQFWRSSLSAAVGDHQISGTYILTASRGFLAKGGVLAPIEPYSQLLAPGILDVIALIQHDAKAGNEWIREP